MKTILFNGHDILLFVIIYVCLMFSVITLITHRRAGWTHLWLGLFLLTQAGLSAYVLAMYGAGFHQWAASHIPWIFPTLEVSFWAEGPLLMLYTRAALYQQFRFQRSDLTLLIPLLLFVGALLFVTLGFQSDDQSAFLRFLHSENVQYYEHLRNFVRVGFGVWAFLIIRHYQRHLPDAYSNFDLLQYSWLKLLVIGYVILRLWSEFYLSLYTLVAGLFDDSMTRQIDFDLMGIVSNYGQLILISFLLYFGLSDSRHIGRISQDTIKVVGEADTDNRPGYTSEQVHRVREHMDRHRPYLDSQIKIDDLAHQVSLSSKVLSSLINREFSMNFFEFINSYRLKEVKGYLADESLKDESIIDLAFRAGYNSKTTFNRLFKQETGETPSQFRQLKLNSHC